MGDEECGVYPLVVDLFCSVVAGGKVSWYGCDCRDQCGCCHGGSGALVGGSYCH